MYKFHSRKIIYNRNLGGKKSRMKKSYIYMVIFAFIIIAIAEIIGIQIIPIGEKLALTILPLAFAILFTMLLGLKPLRKGIMAKIYTKENVNFAGKYLIIIMLPLMARYGATIAPQLKDIISKGPIFLFQELGNLGTVVLGLPVAILLGLKREAIGCTLGLGREGELAYISERYTLDSPEGRGVLSLYIIGTLFGALFFSFFAPILSYVGYSPQALAMASGVGSGSMMAASSSALTSHFPELGEQITAYASASNLLTSFLGTYSMLFLAAPLQNFMYKLLTRGDKK